MKLPFFVIVAAMLAAPTVVCEAAAKNGDVIYRCSFSHPTQVAFWQGLANSRVAFSPTPKGDTALVITNPVGGPTATAVSVPLDLAKLKGMRVLVSAYVSAENVVKPQNAWNGVKVMLVVKSPTGDQYDQVQNVYGTFDWTWIQFTSDVPEQATSVSLVLGIENTSGRAAFDHILITSSNGQNIGPK